MAITTPNAKNHEGLSALASRYVTVSDLPWAPTRFPGVDIKVLMEDKETGLLTALTRLAPGAVLPDHEHVDIEQSYVLEGSLADGEGVAAIHQRLLQLAERFGAHWQPAALIERLSAENKHFSDVQEGRV